MVTPTATLLYETTDNGKVYYIQYSSTFSGPNYLPDGSTIVQTPVIQGGDLVITLKVLNSSDGVNPVEHEVYIGTFPQQISTWKLVTSIVDDNETVVGGGTASQDESDAEER